MAATQKKKQQEAPAPQVEARIDRMVDGDYKTKAYASVTIAGAFAVHGLRVIETDKGRFISMPQESYKKNGETVYNDTFHASPPRQGLRWWMRSTMLTSRGCRNAWSRARTYPLKAWNSRCKRHGAKGGDGTWCDSPWITEIGSSFTAILWAM